MKILNFLIALLLLSSPCLADNSIDEVDADLMLQTMVKSLSVEKVPEEIAWKNEQSGHSGTSIWNGKVGRMYNGAPCRGFIMTILLPEKITTDGVACLDKRGVWGVVSMKDRHGREIVPPQEKVRPNKGNEKNEFSYDVGA